MGNDVLRKMVGVVKIAEVIREAQLRWCGHFQRWIARNGQKNLEKNRKEVRQHAAMG